MIKFLFFYSLAVNFGERKYLVQVMLIHQRQRLQLKYQQQQQQPLLQLQQKQPLCEQQQ